jgi:hypothetical protein
MQKVYEESAATKRLRESWAAGDMVEAHAGTPRIHVSIGFALR